MTSGLHNFLLEISYLSCLGYFYLMSCISLAALKILFFRSLILKCLGVDLFEFILLGIYSAVWMYRVMLFIKILDNLGHCFLKYFLCSFSLAFSYFIFFSCLFFWDFNYPHVEMPGSISQVSETLLIFVLFSSCSSDWIISIIHSYMHNSMYV